MKLFDRLKGKTKSEADYKSSSNTQTTDPDSKPEKRGPASKYKDIIKQIKDLPGTKLGGVNQQQIIQVDLKKVHHSWFIEILKRNHSLEEQNRHLQEYLTAMVKENESLQEKLQDKEQTLKHNQEAIIDLSDQLEELKKKVRLEQEFGEPPPPQQQPGRVDLPQQFSLIQEAMHEETTILRPSLGEEGHHPPTGNLGDIGEGLQERTGQEGDLQNRIDELAQQYQSQREKLGARTDEVEKLRGKTKVLRSYVRKLKSQLDHNGYAYSEEYDSEDSATSDLQIEPEDVEVAQALQYNLQEVLDNMLAQQDQQDTTESLAFYDGKGRLWRLEHVDEKEIEQAQSPQEIYITNQQDQPSSLRNRLSAEQPDEGQGNPEPAAEKGGDRSFEPAIDPATGAALPSEHLPAEAEGGVVPTEELDMLAIMHDKLNQEKEEAQRRLKEIQNNEDTLNFDQDYRQLEEGIEQPALVPEGLAAEVGEEIDGEPGIDGQEQDNREGDQDEVAAGQKKQPSAQIGVSSQLEKSQTSSEGENINDSQEEEVSVEEDEIANTEDQTDTPEAASNQMAQIKSGAVFEYKEK